MKEAAAIARTKRSWKHKTLIELRRQALAGLVNRSQSQSRALAARGFSAASRKALDREGKNS